MDSLFGLHLILDIEKLEWVQYRFLRFIAFQRGNSMALTDHEYHDIAY